LSQIKAYFSISGNYNVHFKVSLGGKIIILNGFLA